MAIKIDSNYIITAEEWQLVSHTIALLEPFYKVTQQCSRSNKLLSSELPHVKILKFSLILMLGQSGSKTLTT